MGRLDWSVIRGASIALTLSLLVALTLLYFAQRYRDRQYTAERTAQAEFLSISERYLNVDREGLIIEQRYPRFLELLDHHVLGAEDRLSWVEALKSTAADLDVQRLDYRIEPRSAYLGPAKVAPGPFEVLASRMHITATLWHEGDLPRLLATMEQRAHGLMLPRHCGLKRVTGASDLRSIQTRGTVELSCEIDWVTVDWPGDRELGT